MDLSLRKKHYSLQFTPTRLKEVVIFVVLGSISAISIFTVLSVIFVLMHESLEFFSHVALSDFLFGKKWSALIEPKSFGILPLLSGTFVISIGALSLAVPLGLGGAFFLSEICSRRVRRTLKPIIELLAGIPSVVFGYFAVTSITPLLQYFIPTIEVFNALSAAIVLGIMILPMMISLCDDTLQAQSSVLRQAAYALGATKSEVCLGILSRASISGFTTAILLSFSRGIGETMAVALAAGSTPQLTLNPLVSIQTMTGYIVQVSMGDTPHGSIEYQSLFVVATYLFCVTLAINLFSRWIVRRFGHRYD